MWRKLHKKLNTIFKKEGAKNKEANPQELLQFALKEITLSIKKNEKALLDLHKNQTEIGTTLHSYKEKFKAVATKTKQIARLGSDKKLRLVLAEKSTIIRQLNDYQVLYDNTSHAISQIVEQLEKLKLQKKETKSKEVILKAKLETAKSSLELNQCLNELESTQGIELFEDEICRIEIEASLTNEVLSLERKIKNLEDEDLVADFKEKMREEELEQQRKIQEEQLKRVNQLFAESDAKKATSNQKEEKNQSRKQTVKNLRHRKKDSAKKKEDVVGDFFQSPINKEKEEKIISPQNENSIDDFFSEDKKDILPREDNHKKDILDDFFGE